MNHRSEARPTARCAPASMTPSRNCRLLRGRAATAAEIASHPHVCRCRSCPNRFMASTIVSRAPAATYAWGEHQGRRYEANDEVKENSAINVHALTPESIRGRSIFNKEEVRISRVSSELRTFTRLKIYRRPFSAIATFYQLAHPVVEKSALKLVSWGRRGGGGSAPV